MLVKEFKACADTKSVRLNAIETIRSFVMQPSSTFAFGLAKLACIGALTGLLAACQTIPSGEIASEAVDIDSPKLESPGVRSARTSMIAPIVETRESITATGYAVISLQNHTTPAQKRLLAIRASKLDAYRSLTEQVYGQHLNATTTVADMTVMSDTFRTRVEGVIYGAVLVSISPAGDDTYETTMSLDSRVVDDLRALYLGQLASKAN